MRLIVRIKKTLGILMIGVLTAIMLTACGELSKTEAQEKVNENLQKGFLEAGAQTDTYNGKITAIEGDTITIAMASDMGEGGSAPESKPTGEEVSITINDKTTFMEEDTKIALKDFATGDIVTVSMSGDKVLSVSKGIHKMEDWKGAEGRVSENRPPLQE